MTVLKVLTYALEHDPWSAGSTSNEKCNPAYWKHRHVVKKSPVFIREGDGIEKDCFHFSDQFDICMESKICYCRTCLVVVKIKFSNKGQTWQRMKLKIHFI